MSEAFSEAISDDESPAPDAAETERPLLGDPATEANTDFAPDVESEPTEDDLHDPLNDADVQN